jgi:hypothetical protein
MMRANRRVTFGSAAAISLCIGALTACTTATPYQPYRTGDIRTAHGGYSEQRLAADRFLVRFHGNDLTSRERVEGYMLYRAAELTLQNGYDSFEIIERHTEHDVETRVRPDPFYPSWYGSTYGGWRPHWRYYYPDAGWSSWTPYGYGYGSVDVQRVESFEAEAEIIMRRGVSDLGRRVFDARRVIADLGPTIQRPGR